MENESRVTPVLGHLAWLLDRIDAPVNANRLRDAALLTYNAAVMLQWRFVTPVSFADVCKNDASRMKAAEVIDALVNVAEKVSVKPDDVTDERDKRLRAQLMGSIRKVLATLPSVLLITTPAPARMPELERSVNAKTLLDEFLAVRAKDQDVAVLEGRLAAGHGHAGPDAAFRAAIAALIYTQDRAHKGDMPYRSWDALARLAAGFLKTAVEAKADELPPPQLKRLLRLADALITSAATSTSVK